MWQIDKTDSEKYPYRISITYKEKTNITLFAGQAWANKNQSIFCVKTEAKPDISVTQNVEKVNVVSARWLEKGTKLSLVLDRKTQSKCEFRFVKKRYKDKAGEYEQIFFKSKEDELTTSMWMVEKVESKRFPYRISIVENNEMSLTLMSQDKWPGSSGNIFCVRADAEEKIVEDNVIEQVPVVFVKRMGKRLTVLLDRSMRKRCEFLFLRKQYKNKEGDYEQIFFRTQQGISQHKSRGNLSLQPKNADLDVIIDSNERYPWKFGEHNTQRENLTVGDYALLYGGEIKAVVERKTFENMLGDIGKIQVLHQQLTELSMYPHAALVIEAQYGDFLSSDRIGKWSSVAHMGRALAEITVLHPKLPIIFAGNRKQGNHWSLRFFEGVLKKLSDPTNDAIATAVAKTRGKVSQDNPIWLQVKRAVLDEMPHEFKFVDLSHHLKHLKSDQVRTQLYKLRENGAVEQVGKGRASKWVKNEKNE